MRRTFIIKLSSETTESMELIKSDLELEIGCCWNSFNIDEIIETTEDNNT